MINIPKASRFALISNRFQEMILIQIVIVIQVFFSTSNTSSRSSSSKSRITVRTRTKRRVGSTKQRTHFPEDRANNSAAEIRTKRSSLKIEKARDRDRDKESVLRAVY